MNEIIVKDDLEIPFIACTDKYGRAEFDICFKCKRGKVTEYYVYPRQQENQKYFWHYVGTDNMFSIHSDLNLEEAKVWRIWYCKEHKTTSISIYVPIGSSVLRMGYYGIEFA